MLRRRVSKAARVWIKWNIVGLLRAWVVRVALLEVGS